MKHTISVRMFRDSCTVTLPPNMENEWRKDGWKTEDDLKNEAELRAQQAKEANKSAKNNA